MTTRDNIRLLLAEYVQQDVYYARACHLITKGELRLESDYVQVI